VGADRAHVCLKMAEITARGSFKRKYPKLGHL